MTSAKSLTRGEWEARAIVLAEDAHLVHRARYLGQGVQGASLWQVPSKASDGVYVVHIWQHAGATCNCTAGSYGRACGHAGAAILAERQKHEAERASGQSEAWRYWLNGGSWE
ncbi:MAG TPA: hypothetical protein VGS80_20370 [Ktedonobacterales bacterium]|nr:hypothetical protein [Ktedonobacterales bacterium]